MIRMDSRMDTIRRAIGAVVVLAIGVALGVWWATSRVPALAPVAGLAAAGGQPVVLYWYDPMVPDQHFDKPGKSPFMDMQLVPKYADDSHAAGGVAIAPGVRQNLGVRTVVVERGRLDAVIEVPGTLAWDLRKEQVVDARVDLIVDRLYVKAPFTKVRAGEPIASVIAPVWSGALAEAKVLRESSSPAREAWESAAQARLRALGLPAGAHASDNGTIVLTSPVQGVVSEIGVREGQSVPAGTLLFRVNGTATVWLEAAFAQSDVAGIRPGAPVNARIDAVPGAFSGRIESLLPEVDERSRTQRARVVLDNAGGALAPGMNARVRVRSLEGAERPLVPTNAVLGGGGATRVIVQGRDARFRPVLVQTGRSSGGYTEIVTGLAGGERVVASAQFLIDSEASLSGALDRLGADQPLAPEAQP